MRRLAAAVALTGIAIVALTEWFASRGDPLALRFIYSAAWNVTRWVSMACAAYVLIEEAR